MSKRFEEKIKKAKVRACRKVNKKWSKQLESLKLWEKEAENRKRVEQVCKSVRMFVSLSTDDASEKMIKMTPRGLIEEVTGSTYYTTPFCSVVADFEPKWSQDGSFEKSDIAMLKDLISLARLPPLIGILST